MADHKYQELENKWREYWEQHPELYRAIDNSTKPKKYILVEFPYPSGSGLHVGHGFSYTGGDVYSRFKRMQGYNVLFPMGWDAFGLPTENHAIKTKQKPQTVTKKNTEAYREEMKKLAFSFDWSREVNTTDPSYYKWTQWIFIKLFEAGLAYKKEMPINWCPSCKIGLANEEVIDNKCERCGTEVSRRNISQWVVKITDYADRLAEGLKETDFIDKVKQAQINWIGKSEGARINFKLKITNYELKTKELEVFTTRPDTLCGATFMVISPEHKLALELSENDETIKKYLTDTRKKSEMERTDLNKDKTGVFSGVYAINPVNNKEIPIWISDFVLASYGTGAIMSVPAHDERDFDFAKKYNLPVVKVIDEAGKLINSDGWNGLTQEEAFLKVMETGIGEATANYHLRDWIFSRQHYWGEPIPMIFCEKDGWVTEKIENLPIVLPEVEAYEPTDDGLSPLSRISEFVNCQCPKCGGKAKRETDTMPNWAGSDWYFLRYCDPHNDTEIASQTSMKKWLPVDVYLGGDEHNTLHLLYSRFIHQFLYDLKVVPTPEPYYKRVSHGVILGPDNQRMSKSRGNVITPGPVADKYGVDVTRMYLMFMGPFSGTMAWNENTLMGVKRFLDRFEKFIIDQNKNNNASDDQVNVTMSKLIEGITNDLEEFKYNTVIAKLMEGINKLAVLGVGKNELENLVKLIAPFAPYIAEELWNQLGHKDSIHQQSWPIAEKKYLLESTVMMPVAINGKTRAIIEIQSNDMSNQVELKRIVESDIKIKKYLQDKLIEKWIFVTGKMINLVVQG